jgi:hypothetical protein
MIPLGSKASDLGRSVLGPAKWPALFRSLSRHRSKRLRETPRGVKIISFGILKILPHIRLHGAIGVVKGRTAPWGRANNQRENI